MIRKVLMTAVAAIAVAAAGALVSSRANAMPIGLPAAAIDQVDMTEAVALCFYIDGWNGPGMYQCGYRMRRGYGWHGARHDGGHTVYKSYNGGSGHHGSGSNKGGGNKGGGGGKSKYKH